MPKISVITINYNDAKGLLKTMLSVNKQTYADFEHLIIDGNSTDKSREIIANNKQFFTHWISESDLGIYDAQNKGVKMAHGDYCLFLNAGDYLIDENVLEQISSHLDGTDLIYGDMQTCNSDGQIAHLKMHPKINQKILFKDTIWHPVSFFKRKLFERFGNYDLQYKIVADYDLYCRLILKHHISSKYVPLEISVFDTTGISSSIEKKTQLIQERRSVQNKYMNPLLLFVFRIYSKLRN